MITQIGIVAGEILLLCEALSRPLTVTEIEFYLEEPYDTILMSLGWLIREGFVLTGTDREGEEITVERVGENSLPGFSAGQHRFVRHLEES